MNMSLNGQAYFSQSLRLFRSPCILRERSLGRMGTLMGTPMGTPMAMSTATVIQRERTESLFETVCLESDTFNSIPYHT